MRRLIAASVSLFLANTALAGTVIAYDGQDVVVPVDPAAGVTLMLPGAVKIATPPRFHAIQAIVSPAPQQESGQAAPAPMDVRAFSVRATRAASERVTFVLADDRNVTVRFVPTPGADNFYEVRWQKAQSAKNKDSGYLANERAMMLALLRDDLGMGRQIVKNEIKIDRYPQLQIFLVRTYQTDGLSGYVFTVTNTSKEKLQLNPTVVAIGSPNRAVLTQMDHEILKPCSEDNSPNPRGMGCMTALRMVVKGTGALPSLSQDARAALPFMVSIKERE